MHDGAARRDGQQPQVVAAHHQVAARAHLQQLNLHRCANVVRGQAAGGLSQAPDMGAGELVRVGARAEARVLSQPKAVYASFPPPVTAAFVLAHSGVTSTTLMRSVACLLHDAPVGNPTRESALPAGSP